MLHEECSDVAAVAVSNASFMDNLVMEFVVFGLHQGRIHLLLSKNGSAESMDGCELPMGKIYSDESVDGAARRICKEVTGIASSYIDQVKTFGRPSNAQQTISIGHICIISQDQFESVKAYTANHYQWWPLDELPSLVLNHGDILAHAHRELKHRVKFEPVSFDLLPEKFTLLQLQELYETVLGVKVDKPNFRRKVMNLKLLTSCNEKEKNVSHRAANLFSFNREEFRARSEQGFCFQL